MNRIIQADFQRLKKDKLYWILTAVVAATNILRIFFYYRMGKTYDVPVYLEECIFSFILPLCLVLPVFISLLVGSEYSDGTIRNKISVGCFRHDIYFAQLITCVLGSILTFAISFICGCIIGIPLLGMPQMSFQVLLPFALAILCCITSAAIYNLIAMNLSSKAHTVMVCLVVTFGLLFIVLYLSMKLSAPELIEQMALVDGKVVTQTVKNEFYLSGAKREIYQFFYDLIPLGQSLQITSLTYINPLRLGILSVAVSVISSLTGCLLFQKKDIK